MKPLPIPVRMVGPGSQPDDDAVLQYLEMPRGMNTFEMPPVPDTADARAMAQSRELLAGFLQELDGWKPAGRAAGPRMDLAGVPAAALEITNQMLGEGEVSIRVNGHRDVRIQESVFAGIWRVRDVAADGTLAGDWLEAGPLPAVALETAQAAAEPRFDGLAVPAGAMNSPALLREIESQCRGWRPGGPAHVINLTLFPMVPEDHALLEQALPVGPVAMISRGFGNCHISSTGVRNVWRVQYFNNMKTLILNTLEVIDVPEEAIAAPEDLEDSRGRLAELIEWMDETAR